MKYRLQQAVMRRLDAAWHRKLWAYELDVSESELSRWSSGKRGMPVDYVIAALRYLKSEGQYQVVERILAELLEGLDEAPEPQPADPQAALVETLQAATAITVAAADGVIDDDEVPGVLREVNEAIDALSAMKSALERRGLRRAS